MSACRQRGVLAHANGMPNPSGSSCVYLQEEAIGRPDAHPGLVAVPAHELERLRGPRRGGRRHDSAGAVDANELVAEHAQIERRLVNPPQLQHAYVVWLILHSCICTFLTITTNY